MNKQMDGCTCDKRAGDDYYCSLHGGEGSWTDLRIKSDMLIEKLGEWIVLQESDVRQSAKKAFGIELKQLGQLLHSLNVSSEKMNETS